MSRGFIIGTGGGGKAFAWITAVYPAGSSCTCTSGSKVLTAEGTGGQWVFAIPSTGTWTVRCTDGSHSSSQNVSITARNQAKSVTLQYDLYIVQSGRMKAQFTTNGAAIGDTENGVDFYTERNGAAYTAVQNLGNFSTLKIQFLYLNGNVKVGIFRNVSSGYAASVTLQAGGQATVDISSYDGSGYVAISSEDNAEGYVKITEMVLQ